ncbi:DUF3810 domain-containing protein [Eubacteriales bacterium mix99]
MFSRESALFGQKRKSYKKYWLILLLPLGWLINVLSREHSLWTEKYYSGGIYKGISWLIGKLLGWIPFSVGEMLVAALLLIVLWRLAVLIRGMIRDRRGRWTRLRNFVLNALFAVSLLYSLFLVLWGFNYNRLSFSEITGLEIQASSTEELVQLSQKLAKDANTLRKDVSENPSGVMVPFGGAEGGFRRCYRGYEAASRYVPELKSVRSRPKPLLFSPVIAYTHIWGIYCPFTVESNVNMKIPTPMILSTMMHETAHQLGFAREDEANYIAYLTCSLHPDVDFQYAGALFALDYTLDTVYGLDENAYRDLYNELDQSVRRDLAESSKYQEKYDGPIRRASSRSNDLYLKANHQEDGERSYGRMVDLLLAQYRCEKEN